LTDVNHLDLVGWTNTARYKWAEMMGKDIKFRPATFYLEITDWLARDVEGQPPIESNRFSMEQAKPTNEPTRVNAIVEGNDGGGVPR
jgi:hypothetical protein